MWQNPDLWIDWFAVINEVPEIAEEHQISVFVDMK